MTREGTRGVDRSRLGGDRVGSSGMKKRGGEFRSEHRVDSSASRRRGMRGREGLNDGR